MPARDDADEETSADLLKEAPGAPRELAPPPPMAPTALAAEDAMEPVQEVSRPVAVAVDPPAPVHGDDHPPRDSIVPRGTFASEGPPEPAPLPERQENGTKAAHAPEREPRVESREEAAQQTKGSNNSQRLRVARAPERPPFLASEILREDLAPSTPGMTIAAAVTTASSAVGVASVLAGGFENLAALVLSSTFVLLFALSRIRHAQLTYGRRAAAMAGLAAVALLTVEYKRLSRGAPVTELLLTLSTTLLPAALYARAWYRGSLTARVLVGLTLAPAFGWALATTHRELLSLAFNWESWLPALTWCLFAILCLLALLAFMGSETTGGCNAWAIGLAIWYALFAGVRYALEADASPVMRTLGLAAPALAAPFAVALAQLLSQALARKD